VGSILRHVSHSSTVIRSKNYLIGTTGSIANVLASATRLRLFAVRVRIRHIEEVSRNEEAEILSPKL
jgi:hypothetical protein